MDAHTLSMVATCVCVLNLPHIYLFLILPISMMKTSLRAFTICVGVSQPYHDPE